MGAMLTGA